MSFCFLVDNRVPIKTEHFDQENSLPIDQIFKQYLFASAFELFPRICPQYMNKMYKKSKQNNNVTKNSSLKPFQPLRTKTLTHKCLSYLRWVIWNDLSDHVKLSDKVNVFRLKVRKSFLTLLREKDQDIYVSYV